MARVIKAAARIVPGPIVDARAEAARIVEAARSEAERIRAEAARAGHLEGDARAAAMLLRAGAARDEALARLEAEVREVALDAAARIVEEHVALGPDRTLAIVRAALDRARRARQVRVRVHPEDAAAVAAMLPAGATAVADETLARGDCVVESDLGTVDARIAAKLAALRAALEGAR